jgi:predicted metallopeptidase
LSNNPTTTLDLGEAAAALSADLCRQLPELRHIAPERLLFCISRSRAAGKHGVYARIAPLRFAGGAREVTRRRLWRQRTWRMPELHHGGHEILYLVYFMVPRFLRLPPRQKLATLVHELYHISERCDGDIRRFPGRNFAHGASRQRYDRTVDALVERYLAGTPSTTLLAPLEISEEDWQTGRIRVTGLTVPLPRPRLIERRRT